MKFHIYQDRKGEWRWRLKARNGRIVADSGEGYKTRSGVRRALTAFRDNCDRWRWPLIVVEKPRS